MGRRIIIAAVGLFTLWFVVTFFVDGPPPDDADLAWPARTIPDEENGYARMLELWENDMVKQELKQLSDQIDTRSQKPISQKQFAKIESALAGRFQELEQLASIENWQSTETPTNLPGSPNGAAACLHLVKTHRAKIRFLIASENIPEALKAAATQLKFSQRLQSSHGSMLTNTIGSALYRQSLSDLSHIVLHCPTQHEHHEMIASMIEDSSISQESFAASLRFEYQYAKQTLKSLTKWSFAKSDLVQMTYSSKFDLPEPLLALSFKRNDSVQKLGGKTRTAISALKDGRSPERMFATHSLWRRFFTGEAASSRVAKIYASSQNLLFENLHQTVTSRDLLSLQIACESFYLDHEEYPSNLADLTPDYASESLSASIATPFSLYDPDLGIIISYNDPFFDLEELRTSEKPLSRSRAPFVLLKHATKRN